MFLIIIPLILSTIGALTPIVYLINYFFYKPKPSINVDINEGENNDVKEISILIGPNKKDIKINKIILYLNPKFFNIKHTIDNINAQAIVDNPIIPTQNYYQQPLGYIGINLNIQGYLPKEWFKNNSMAIHGELKCKKNEEKTSEIILVVETQLSPDSLPFLIDMFPLQVTKTKICKIVSSK